MKLTVNGQPEELPDGLRLDQLIERLGLRPEVVATERNGQLVPRRAHAETALAEGDVVEVVTLVGGG